MREICLSLVRLLHYLAHSPLGSITLLDFRPRQFVIVDGELKVTDLDDASADEAPCSSSADCFMEFPARNFTLHCSSQGLCQSINEKRNLYNAYRFFFTYLLPHSAPTALRPLLDTIVNSTGELRWGIDETLSELEKLLHLYSNGLYLQNTTQAPRAEYKRVVGASIAGDNYRCWPSYNHEGCLLSVFSIQEAMDVCESHSQCHAFVLTNQTTWTGEHRCCIEYPPLHSLSHPYTGFLFSLSSHPLLLPHHLLLYSETKTKDNYSHSLSRYVCVFVSMCVFVVVCVCVCVCV
ncbi:UNVERIFIED_CONTAM: hypothetical protein FKN15_014112 [Acipenser sinensis]